MFRRYFGQFIIMTVIPSSLPFGIMFRAIGRMS